MEKFVGINIKILSFIKSYLSWIIKNLPELIIVACIICLTIHVYKTDEYSDRPEANGDETRMIVVYVDTPDRIIYTKNEEEQVESAILDVEYLAKCVEAEAGNQGELGKRYVICCILNRFETGNYSNIRDVINAPGQFACVVNGDIDSPVKQENIDLIYDELQNRTNSEIKYFRTGSYHTFGTPCFQYEDHFFSK